MKYIEELEKMTKLVAENSDLPDYFNEQFLDFKQENQAVNKKKVGINRG